MAQITQAFNLMAGVLYGDCLGAPYEFSQPKADEPLVVSKSIFGHKAGRGTDDTETTLAVANGLIRARREGSDNPTRAIAEELLSWYRSAPLDVGGTTGFGLRNFAQTGDPMTGQVSLNSQANGSLMRSAPFAILPNGPELAVLSSMTTHAHPVVLMCVRAYVEMLQMLLSGRAYPRTLNSRDIREIPGGGGYVYYAFQLAIWAATEADDFESGLEEVIRLGGDTDTNGAICGAVLAARFGFPMKLVEALDSDRVVELIDLAAQLTD